MQQQFPQKPGLDIILKQAFSYWSKTIGLQLMFSIIYFGIFISAIHFFMGYYGIYNHEPELQAALSKGFQEYAEKSAALSSTVEFSYFRYAFIGVLVFLGPLNIGFFQIYKKIDLKENVGLSDLFAGYRGLNFFKFISFYLFWFLLLFMLAPLIIFPFFWILITIFSTPLIFFENKRTFETLSIGWAALRRNFIEIFVCVLIAAVFSHIGFLFFLIGGLFTFPFWNAIAYSLYTNILENKRGKLP